MPNEMRNNYHIAVVIPCYNAGNRLEKVVRSLIQYPVDIFIVDDGSTDDCIEPLINLPVSIISFPKNRGKGFAIIEGLRQVLNNSDYESICFLDADGQHDPQLLPIFIDTWKMNNADMVIGQREFEIKKTPLPSKIGNCITHFILRVLVKCPLSDTQCGYRLYSRSFAQEIVEYILPGRYETETLILLLAISKKKKIATVPIPLIYEEKNRSSHFRKIYDSLRILSAILSFMFGKRFHKNRTA